jgi:hypothetical protein
MATNPDDIHLDDNRRRDLAEAADETGKAWTEVFDEALKRYRTAHPSQSGNGTRTRRFGAGKNLISIADDFDEPLEDFREYTE